MVGVIVNADDFGLTDGVCRSILELLDQGAISSTTLMVAADGAVGRFRKFDARALAGRAGIHLQLTSGSPVSDHGLVGSIVDARNGRFLDPREGGHPDPEEVYIEWQAQIETGAEALGAGPTHIDTHHGMHRRPDLFEVYVSLAKEWNVPFRGAVGKLGDAIEGRCLPGTTALVREWSGRNLGPAALVEHFVAALAVRPAASVVEVICHPAYVDDELRSVSTLADARQGDHDSVLALRAAGWPERDGHYRSTFREEWPQPFAPESA